MHHRNPALAVRIRAVVAPRRRKAAPIVAAARTGGVGVEKAASASRGLRRAPHRQQGLVLPLPVHVVILVVAEAHEAA